MSSEVRSDRERGTGDRVGAWGLDRKTLTRRRGVRGESGQDGGGGRGRFGCGGCRRGGGALAESRGYDRCTVSFGRRGSSSGGATSASHWDKRPGGRLEHWWGVADAGGVARGIGSIPRRMLGYYATKADFANLKTWIVGILLVAVLNVVGTVRAIVAAVLTG